MLQKKHRDQKKYGLKNVPYTSVCKIVKSLINPVHFSCHNHSLDMSDY